MRHILSILLENEAGALSRVVGLFSARAYNIDSLTVSTTEDATLSRMTIVTHGSDEVIEQITKQLNKLIEVVKVIDLNEYEQIESEMMLITEFAQSAQKSQLRRFNAAFTLNGFNQNRACLGTNGGLNSVKIIERHKIKAFNWRTKAIKIFLIAARRYCGERAAMKGPFKSDNTKALRPIAGRLIFARHFDRTFQSLCA